MVDLTNNRMNGQMTAAVCEALQSHVHTLVLDKNKVGKKGADALRACAGRLRLQTLSLSECDVGEHAVENVVRTLVSDVESAAAIRVLGLRGNGISHTGTVNVLSLFLKTPGCPLESLDLSWNALQTEGGAILLNGISGALKSNGSSQLKALHLEFTGLSDDTVSSIADLMTTYVTIAGAQQVDDATARGKGEDASDEKGSRGGSEDDDEEEEKIEVDLEIETGEGPVAAPRLRQPVLELSVLDNQVPSASLDDLVGEIQGGLAYPVRLLYSVNQLKKVTVAPPKEVPMKKTATQNTAGSTSPEGGARINERTGFRSSPSKKKGNKKK